MSNHPEQAHDTIRPYRSAHTKIVLEGGGQLRYWPCFFEPLLAETLYDWLRRDVPWQQMKFPGRGCLQTTPRTASPTVTNDSLLKRVCDVGTDGRTRPALRLLHSRSVRAMKARSP